MATIRGAMSGQHDWSTPESKQLLSELDTVVSEVTKGPWTSKATERSSRKAARHLRDLKSELSESHLTEDRASGMTTNASTIS